MCLKKYQCKAELLVLCGCTACLQCLHYTDEDQQSGTVRLFAVDAYMIIRQHSTDRDQCSTKKNMINFVRIDIDDYFVAAVSLFFTAFAQAFNRSRIDKSFVIKEC